MKTIQIRVLPNHGQKEEIQTWTIKEVLKEINRDRSNHWIDYDESDWKEGWYDWIEGEYYSLINNETNL